MSENLDKLHQLELLMSLTTLGDFYSLRTELDEGAILEQLGDLEHAWVTYNKSKPDYKREGLSLISLNGEVDGALDLNSLLEHNTLHGTSYDEISFRTPTPYWRHLSEISQPLNDLLPHLGRSHLIRFGKGGFFPPHRDLGRAFRLIAFLGCDHECLYVILDGKRVNFAPGKLYFMNTRLTHTVFSFIENAKILVLNVELSPGAVKWVQDRLSDT